MRSITKIIIVIAILLVTFGLPVLLEQAINPTAPASSNVGPSVIATVAVDDIRFLSLPPVLVTADSLFVYKLVATSLSGEAVTISVQSKPEWMEWNSELQQLQGTVPSVGGVFSVTIRATTLGGASADQVFTATIDQPQEVKGATTIALWRDPFHPNPAEVQNVEQLIPSVASSGEPPPAIDVLGEKSVKEPFDDVLIVNSPIYYGVIAVTIVLIVLIILLVVKIIKVAKQSKPKGPSGVIIERGQR